MEPKKPKDDKYMADVRDGMFNGINGDWEKLKALITDTGNKIHTNYIQGMGDNGNLKGLQNVMTGQTQPQVPHMADGGDVPSVWQNLMNSPMANIAGTGARLANDVIDPLQGVSDMVQSWGPKIMQAEGPMVSAIASKWAGQPSTPPPAPQQPPVDQDFVNQLNQGIDMTPPSQNPVSSTMAKAQSMPSTPPSIYQGMTAADRADMMQRLIAQKNSGGMLVAKGAAGLGDAITSAFGKTPTNAIGNIRDAADKNVEQRIGVMDTERKQKVEDLQANQEQLMNDPNSTLSQSMRQTLKSAGMNVPSGMSGAIMLKIAGPLGELAMKQAMLMETERSHKSDESLKQEGFKENAQKELANMGMLGRIENSITPTGRAAIHGLESTAGFNTEASSSASGGHPGWSNDKEARYQQWKASHGA